MNAEEFIYNIDQATIHAYVAYWTTRKPITNDDYFRRWLFALLSVHTTWEINVNSYNMLKDLIWTDNFTDLMQKLTMSRSGLVNHRSTGIWDLYYKFQENPSNYIKNNNESWQEYRNRLAKDVFFLGYAKTSFAISLCYPIESETICLDTHLLKFLKHPSKSINKKDYIRLENKWLDICQDKEVPPSICREIYWDNVQKKKDSSYWANYL